MEHPQTHTNRSIKTPRMDTWHWFVCFTFEFQIQQVCSRVPDPKAFHIDTFTLKWSNYKCYCFCPFSIIGKVLCKIESDNICHAALIVMFHPSSAWFPRFIMMRQNILILLPPETSSQLFLPWDKSIKHPLKNHMHLILGDLCSSSFNTTAYTPGRHVILQTMAGERVQVPDMPLAQGGGYNFAKKPRLTNMTWT